MPFKYNLAGIIGNHRLGLQAYPTSIRPLARLPWPSRASHRPRRTPVRRDLSATSPEAWILQDAENWA